MKVTMYVGGGGGGRSVGFFEFGSLRFSLGCYR